MAYVKVVESEQGALILTVGDVELARCEANTIEAGDLVVDITVEQARHNAEMIGEWLNRRGEFQFTCRKKKEEKPTRYYVEDEDGTHHGPFTDYDEACAAATSGLVLTIPAGGAAGIVCEGCGGRGYRTPATPSCSFPAHHVQLGWVFIERCDACGQFDSDLAAAQRVSLRVLTIRCVDTGSEHVMIPAQMKDDAVSPKPPGSDSKREERRDGV